MSDEVEINISVPETVETVDAEIEGGETEVEETEPEELEAWQLSLLEGVALQQSALSELRSWIQIQASESQSMIRSLLEANQALTRQMMESQAQALMLIQQHLQAEQPPATVVELPLASEVGGVPEALPIEAEPPPPPVDGQRRRRRTL